MDFENQSDLQVQKIMDKKVFNGKTLYLVKWQNYPLEEATWECNKILSNVKDKIREFKYSKRASEDLPNIKIEEDMPEGEIRDTFKRKRGRPPRMSFSSYRQVANQPDKKSSVVQKDSGLNSKRKRGRPRGSKNKRPRQIHFEEQSSMSFDSEQINNQKELDKTLTNSDLQGNTLQQHGDKKLKKLRKIKDKKKQKMGFDQTDTERFTQEEFDIVDSEQEESKEKRVNFNSGQNIISENVSINKELSIFYLEKSQLCQAKNEENQQIVKGKQNGTNGQNQNKKQKSQIRIGKNIQKGFEVIQLDDFINLQKQTQIKLKQNSNKLSHNVQKKLEQMNPIKLNQVNLVEQSSQKKNYIKSSEKLNEGRKNDDTEDNLNMKNKLKLSIKEKSEIKTSQDKFNKASQNLLSQIEPELKVNTNFEIQTKKQKENQRQQLSLNSKRSEKNEGENVKQFEHERISKIYYLETIELPFLDSKFPNQFSYPSKHDCLSIQNLEKLSQIKSIVDQQIHPIKSSRKTALNINPSDVQNDKTASRIPSQQERLGFFQIICSFIKENPSYQNQKIVGLILQYFTVNRSSLDNPQIHKQHAQGLQQISLEPLYLVEFDQGKHIKKLTSSELLLYMIIDSIRTLQAQCLIQCLSLSLHNFTFYIKFLQNLTIKHQSKNQPTLKIEKHQSKNLKMEDKDKTHNEKQELQELLLEAMKNIQKKKGSSRFIRSKKKKNHSNAPQELNEKELMKATPQNLKLKKKEKNHLKSSDKEVQALKMQESSEEETINEQDINQH